MSDEYDIGLPFDVCIQDVNILSSFSYCPIASNLSNYSCYILYNE